MCTLLQATAEANNLAAVAESKDIYIKQMEEVCGGKKPYLNTAAMQAEHSRIKDKALLQFHTKRKMGGEEFSEKYRDQLEKVIIIVGSFFIVTLLKYFRIWKKLFCSLKHIMKPRTYLKRL